MSNDSGPASLECEGIKALVLMEEALELLDACDCTADIGAHLDLAICRLKELVPPKQSDEQ